MSDASLDLNLGTDIGVDLVHIDLATIDSVSADAVGVDVDIDRLLTTYEEWIQSEGMAESTAGSYRNGAKHFLHIIAGDDSATIHDIEPDRLKEYLKVMANPGIANGTTEGVEPYGSATVRGRHASIRKLYEFLNEQSEELIGNPAGKVTLDFLDNTSKMSEAINDSFYALRPEQKEVLAENVQSPAIQNELLVRMAYQTGVRVSELVNLELENVDREVHVDGGQGIISVPAIKSKNPRKLTYGKPIGRLLDEWIDGGHRIGLPGVSPENPYLFPSPEGDCRHLTRSHVNSIVVEAAEDSGLQREAYVDKQGLTKHVVHIHTLRHSFAVQSLRNGMNLRDLQKAMGHSDIRNTLGYLRALNEDHLQRCARHQPGPTNDNAEVARTEPAIDANIYLSDSGF